jgi:hypothetical protein
MIIVSRVLAVAVFSLAASLSAQAEEGREIRSPVHADPDLALRIQERERLLT